MFNLFKKKNYLTIEEFLRWSQEIIFYIDRTERRIIENKPQSTTAKPIKKRVVKKGEK